MDPSSFGSLISAFGGGGGGAGGGGGLSGMLAKAQAALRGTSMAPPQVPADGVMQPTIGPGMTPPAAAAPYKPKLGMPPGGIIGMLQGQSPQGIMGLLQHMAQPPGSSLAGGMPPAGMIAPQPVPAQPVQPAVAPQLPTNITPDNQF